MKKQFLSFALILGVTTSAYSQQTCPLTNAKLTDLRSAASKLAKTITMSAECQSYQNTVNQANKDLQNIANQIKVAEEKRAAEAAAAAGTTTASSTETGPDKAQLAIAAVTQLDTINSVFKDPKCGQQLAGFLDYADAFVDVVNGMTPFLALYGGSEAAPWVLGPAIGGAAVKALISFFKNKSVNMRNPDQSNAFIKNSCAFYNLNLIKNSLDEVQLNQTPRIETEKRQAEAALRNMNKSAPSKPNNSLAKELALAEKDQSRIKSLQDQMKLDATEGCSYLVAYVTESDKNAEGSLLDRVWRNYETNSSAGFRLDLEKRYFHQDLTQAIVADNTKCSSLGTKWINKMITFNEVGLTALRKAADEDDQVKTYRAYLAEKEKQEMFIKSLEGRLKFFQEMTGPGFSIEYSEIIRSHRLVQDTLFITNKFIRVVDMGGIAFAWLKVKKEDADSNLDDFEYRRKEVQDRIQDLSRDLGVNDPMLISRDMIANHVKNLQAVPQNKSRTHISKSVLVDVCNELRTAWASWYSALIHARAGRDYCVAFDNVINELDYRRVQKSCFGEGRNDKSLKQKVVEIQAEKPKADEIIRYMDQYGCRRGSEASVDLLALPVNPT